jgi:hypothetical protein
MILKGVTTIVINVWFLCFGVKSYINVTMCLYKGVFDVLLKDVEQFGMDLMNIKDSKTILKHHNLFFASFLFLIF